MQLIGRMHGEFQGNSSNNLISWSLAFLSNFPEKLQEKKRKMDGKGGYALIDWWTMECIWWLIGKRLVDLGTGWDDYFY